MAFVVAAQKLINLFWTAVPFWGQTSQNLTGFCPQEGAAVITAFTMIRHSITDGRRGSWAGWYVSVRLHNQSSGAERQYGNLASTVV